MRHGIDALNRARALGVTITVSDGIGDPRWPNTFVREQALHRFRQAFRSKVPHFEILDTDITITRRSYDGQRQTTAYDVRWKPSTTEAEVTDQYGRVLIHELWRIDERITWKISPPVSAEGIFTDLSESPAVAWQFLEFELSGWDDSEQRWLYQPTGAA